MLYSYPGSRAVVRVRLPAHAASTHPPTVGETLSCGVGCGVVPDSSLCDPGRQDALNTEGLGAASEERETPEMLVRESVSCYQRALQMTQDNR